MSEIKVFLPDALRKHLETEVASGRHKSASDYICHLVNQEKKQRAKEQIENLLLEALDEGPAEEVTKDYWKEMRQKIRKKATKPTDFEVNS